jgi:hypothetical protein
MPRAQRLLCLRLCDASSSARPCYIDTLRDAQSKEYIDIIVCRDTERKVYALIG